MTLNAAATNGSTIFAMRIAADSVGVVVVGRDVLERDSALGQPAEEPRSPQPPG